MLKTIDISADPHTGLARKAIVKTMVMTEESIALVIIINHYKDGEVFTSNAVKSYTINANTDGFWVNPLTGEAESEDTPGAIPERIFLKNLPAAALPSTTIEGKIMDIITTRIAKMDGNKTLD